MLLVIGRPAQFGENSLPVRGQCQPHVQGWRLRLFAKGQEEVLFEGTYYACRQIQIQCLGLAPERVREKAAVLAGEMADPSEETQKIRMDQESTVVAPGLMQGLVDDSPASEADDIRNRDTTRLNREEMEEYRQALRSRRKSFED